MTQQSVTYRYICFGETIDEQYKSVADALFRAGRDLSEGAGVPQRIEAPDGTVLDKAAIHAWYDEHFDDF